MIAVHLIVSHVSLSLQEDGSFYIQGQLTLALLLQFRYGICKMGTILKHMSPKSKLRWQDQMLWVTFFISHYLHLIQSLQEYQ